MSIHQTVTNQIIAQLEQGVTPWRKEWRSTLPTNVLTNANYTGVNIPVLWCSALANGFKSSQWGTYNQLQAKGIQVLKGSKATTAIRPLLKKEKNETGQTEESKFIGARAFPLFNLDQTDYIEAEHPTPEITPLISKASDIAEALGVEVNEGEPCYIPSKDSIRMPKFHDFYTYTAYFSTMAHECSHATGHKTRLDRSLSGRFGDDSYAMEELIAELSAAFICAENNLGYDNNHASYLASWLKVLRQDPKAIFTVSAQAQKASNYIKEAVKNLNIQREIDAAKAA